jgi:hypothetical protein
VAEPVVPVEPPPPPAPPGRAIPELSARLDPFNLLLEGTLDVELEVGVLKFLSVEVVPSFVVNKAPPAFGYISGRDEELTRKSSGLGPLSGGALDVGFWLEGRALRGTVLRAVFASESYLYEATDSLGTIDSVKVVERQFFGYLGTHSRWGAFTLAGGFGLGAALNTEKRCFDGRGQPTTACNRNQRQIRLQRTPPNVNFPVADLNGGLGSVRLLGRFSLGVVF